MAITSVGYGGTVDYPDYGKGVVSGARYTLDRGNPFRPSRVTGGADRTVRLTGGTAQGYGIRDTESDAYVDVQLDPVLSGHRWDEIVLRRDWSTETTSLAVIQGGTSRALPTRQKEPGILDDQPIALARVQAGEQYVTDVVDLRCWAGDGGLTAVDTLALAYLDEPGTRVSIGDTTYTYIVLPNGTTRWEQISPYVPPAPVDTGWVVSNISSSGYWSGTRAYRVKNGRVYVNLQGQRQARSFTDGDYYFLTFNTKKWRPERTAYGTAYVGREQYRAYCTVGGECHVEPLTINKGNTIQVQIDWPIDGEG